MKIKYGIPRFNEVIHKNLLEGGWKPLKEPKSITGYIVLSIPFMILNLLLSLLIIGRFLPAVTGTVSGGFIEMMKALFLLLFISIVLIVLHELVHLIFIPDFLHSEKTFIGVASIGGYVYSEEILSKRRTIVILIAPYMFFSIICNIIFGYLDFYNTFILLFIMFNSLGSSVDILMTIFILFQVPRGAKIVMNGSRSYYKVK